MNLFFKITAFSIVINIAVSLVLWVYFGFTTVRRLHKVPEMKDGFGYVFAFGAGALNVAAALSLPRAFVRRAAQLKFKMVRYANIDVIYAHTRHYERVIARIMFWLMVLVLLQAIAFGVIVQHFPSLFQN